MVKRLIDSVQDLPGTEDEILLVPAVYNKKGLFGDFQIKTVSQGLLRPYIQLSEYFRFFDADYVYAYLEPVKGQKLFYKITRDNWENDLKGLEPLVSGIPNVLVL